MEVILFAWLGLLFFFIPLIISAVRGTKGYCNHYCGRGQVFGLLGGRFGLSRQHHTVESERELRNARMQQRPVIRPMPRQLKGPQQRHRLPQILHTGKNQIGIPQHLEECERECPASVIELQEVQP